MIFAVPSFDDGDILVPATEWFWQAGDRWYAVDGDVQSYEEWFGDDDLPDAPEQLVYSIKETPPSGVMVWIDEDRVRQEVPVTISP